MKIRITDSLSLSEYTLNDAPELTHYLNEKGIYDSTINIPFPYNARHANDWIRHTLAERSHGKMPHNFAIRYHDELIGGIGIIFKEFGHFGHQAEIGYWVALPYWNRGFATLAIGTFSRWVFESFSLRKLTAAIFAENISSEKALIRNGYELEGLVREHVCKEGRYIDCKLYAKFR
jgi:ribosomal-protein-alanine N-acetyltransferase